MFFHRVTDEGPWKKRDQGQLLCCWGTRTSAEHRDKQKAGPGQDKQATSYAGSGSLSLFMRLNMPDGAVEILFIALTRDHLLGGWKNGRESHPWAAHNKNNENDAHNEAH